MNGSRLVQVVAEDRIPGRSGWTKMYNTLCRVESHRDAGLAVQTPDVEVEDVVARECRD